jgi:hypothetical protein
MMIIHKPPFAIFGNALYRVEDGHLKHVMDHAGEVVMTVKLLVEYPGNCDRPEPRLVRLNGKCTCPVDTMNHYEDDCTCESDFPIDSGTCHIYDDKKPMLGMELCQELIGAGFTTEEILLIKIVSQGDATESLKVSGLL